MDECIKILFHIQFEIFIEISKNTKTLLRMNIITQHFSFE